MHEFFKDDACYLVRRLNFLRFLVFHIDGSGSDLENEMLNLLDEQLVLLLEKAEILERSLWSDEVEI